MPFLKVWKKNLLRTKKKIRLQACCVYAIMNREYIYYYTLLIRGFMIGYSVYHHLPMWPFLNQLISLNLSWIMGWMFRRVSVKLNTWHIWKSLDKIRQVIYIQKEGKNPSFWPGKLILGCCDTYLQVCCLGVPGWLGIMNIDWSLTAKDVIQFWF